MSEVPSTTRCCFARYIGREKVSEPLGDWMEGENGLRQPYREKVAEVWGRLQLSRGVM